MPFASRKSSNVVSLTFVVVAAVLPAACDGEAPASPPPAEGDPEVGPLRLSETGLYEDIGSRRLAAGVLGFTPAHPLWSDGAQKQRYLLLPKGSKIETREMDRWVFPVGTKAWKEFRVDGKLVETRLLWKRRAEPGIESWWKVSYVWEPDGRDAVAHVEGLASASGTTHDVPSQDDCRYCHLYVRDALIGFSALDLSNDDRVAQTAPGEPATTGLLLPLASQGLFTVAPSADFTVPGSGIVRDALAYLHGNCGFCHNARMEELTRRKIHLRLLTSDTAVETTGAYTTTFRTKMFHTLEGGVDEAIVPGGPDKSQVYVRMTAPDRLRMPPKATKVVDEDGSRIVREWIASLPR